MELKEYGKSGYSRNAHSLATLAVANGSNKHQGRARSTSDLSVTMLWHASDIKSVHVVTLNREKFEDAEVEQRRGKRERETEWRVFVLIWRALPSPHLPQQ